MKTNVMSLYEFKKMVVNNIPSEFISERVLRNIYIYFILEKRKKYVYLRGFFEGIKKSAEAFGMSQSEMDYDRYMCEFSPEKYGEFDITPYRDFWRKIISQINRNPFDCGDSLQKYDHAIWYELARKQNITGAQFENRYGFTPERCEIRKRISLARLLA